MRRCAALKNNLVQLLSLEMEKGALELENTQLELQLQVLQRLVEASTGGPSASFGGTGALSPSVSRFAMTPSPGRVKPPSLGFTPSTQDGVGVSMLL